MRYIKKLNVRHLTRKLVASWDHMTERERDSFIAGESFIATDRHQYTVVRFSVKMRTIE